MVTPYEIEVAYFDENLKAQKYLSYSFNSVEERADKYSEICSKYVEVKENKDKKTVMISPYNHSAQGIPANIYTNIFFDIEDLDGILEILESKTTVK